MFKRAIAIVLAAVVVLGLVFAGLKFGHRQPAQIRRLPDGSEVSLAKVTFGKNHRAVYDNRWQDVIAPVLPNALRSQFGSRMASFLTTSNSMVVWLRHRSAAPPATTGFGSPPYQLAVMNENGLECERLYSPNCSFYPSGGDTFSGWELKEYPRRSGGFKVRVYWSNPSGSLVSAGEFDIRNQPVPLPPVWEGQPLPQTRTTNGLEVTLVKFSTGVTTEESGLGPALKDAKAFTACEFTMRENGKTTEDWSVTGVEPSVASGEKRDRHSSSWSWRDHKDVFHFDGSLWPEEGAWKLKAELHRTRNFPQDRQWTIRNVPVPNARKHVELSIKTNFDGEEIEFEGLSSPNATTPVDWAQMNPYANIHARTPYPAPGTHLSLVEVKDDKGTVISERGTSSRESTGGRGTTMRQMEHAFGIEIPQDAKTLDITFAYTKIVTLEFLAKPVVAEPKKK